MAGSSTLNCLELGVAEQVPNYRYKKFLGDEEWMERLMVDVFQKSYAQPPEKIWLDLDVTDDEIHGHQERRIDTRILFRGYSVSQRIIMSPVWIIRAEITDRSCKCIRHKIGNIAPSQ